MKTKTFALALLTSVLAVPSLAGAQVVIGPGVPVPPTNTIKPRFVGVAISGASGKVYAFKPDNVASAGHNYHLADVLPPYRYASPYGWSQTKGIAADSGGYLKTYFVDNNGYVRVGTGSNTDLTRYSSYLPYVTLPPGRHASQLLDVAIRKSDNRVFAFWKDGKYSYGTVTNLGSNLYNFYPDKPASQIVGLDFDRNGVLVTWYRDGTYGRGPYPQPGLWLSDEFYVDQDILKGLYDPNPNDTLTTPPMPPVVQQTTVPDTNDASVAAGHRYIGVALNAGVRFYDRDGSPLSGGSIDPGGVLDIKEMFDPFVRNNASTPRSWLDVNNYLGMRNGLNDDCEWTPTSTDPNFVPNGFGICVGNQTYGRGMGGPYDTRVLYDRVGRRHVIVAQLRNQLWTRHFSKYPDQKYSPETPDAIPPWTSYYRGTPSILLRNNIGKETRRVLAFAISRTEDPREGWDTYVYAHNIVKDWPHAAINGDWLVLSHRDPSTQGHEKGTIATLVSLADLRAGRAQPAYVRYDQKDLPVYTNGQKPRYVEPAQHLDTTWDRTVLVSGDIDRYAIYTIPHPTQPYGRRPAVLQEFPSMLRPIALGAHPNHDHFEPERSVLRNGVLVTVQHFYEINSGTWGLRHYKTNLIPLSNGGVYAYGQSTGNSHALGQFEVEPMPMINVDGVVSVVFGKKFGDYNMPWIVRRDYANTSMTTYNDTALHVGASFWDVPETRIDAVDALITSVDPNDERRFFYIHRNAMSGTDYQTIMGSYLASP